MVSQAWCRNFSAKILSQGIASFFNKRRDAKILLWERDGLL